MRICHVITRMIVGGAQENTLYSVRGHIERGHEACLITGRTDGPEGNLIDQMNLSGLRLIVIDDLRREISPYHDFIALLRLRTCCLQEQFDIVHTHSSKAGVLGRVAAAWAGVPVVVHTVHGPSFHPYQSWWKNQFYIVLERLASRFSTRTYAVADAMTTLYARHGIGAANQFKTVFSGMDLTPYLCDRRDSALATDIGLDITRPVVGKIARLFELKGYEYLLAAAPRIVAEVPDVQFLVVGDGILRETITEQVQQLGFADRFVFTGLVNPMDIHRYVALMDIVVHLSLREGLPRSVIQGLAGGKPVVAFALDGTPEAVLDSVTGALCPPQDSFAVASALIRLLKNPEEARAMGERGREYVRERWDWRKMVEILEQDYEKLLLDRRLAAAK